MKRRLIVSACALVMGAMAAACGAGQGPATSPQPCPSAAPMVAAQPQPGASAAPTAPTVEEAREFVRKVDADLKKLWMERDRTSWVNMNFITDDTDMLASNAEEA